jgi:hypothetical protein
MRRALRLAIAATLVVGLPACDDGPEPLAPTPLDQGIVVYLHAGFAGTSQAIGVDVRDLSDVEGPCAESDDVSDLTWNDCISSVRVLPGWGATFFGDRDFRGATLEVTEDVPDLAAIRGSCSGSYNDCISSIRVFRR